MLHASKEGVEYALPSASPIELCGPRERIREWTLMDVACMCKCMQSAIGADKQTTSSESRGYALRRFCRACVRACVRHLPAISHREPSRSRAR
mmetsp:Transcript_33825/g.71168  ORF Transcript_33825/g.71168 Transcript_33825/m.71168 type:complete len:93 (+) Transcript_33825:2760-3038(+)